MAAPVEFYFDFGSPYAYLASMRIDGIAARHGRDVDWRPMMLGAAFRLTGMKPNMHQPLRGDYLKHDTQRVARLLGIPFTLPAVMPMNGLVATRAFYWLSECDPVKARRFARAVFHAHWAEGRDLAGVEAVADVARSQGIDADALSQAVQAPALKERVKQVTEQAVGRGVFGAPFIFVDGEPFWGSDRLDMVDRWLATGGW